MDKETVWGESVRDIVQSVKASRPAHIEPMRIWSGRTDANWYRPSMIGATEKDMYRYTEAEPRIAKWPLPMPEEEKKEWRNLSITFVTACPGDSVCDGRLYLRTGLGGMLAIEVPCPRHMERLSEDKAPAKPTVALGGIFGDEKRRRYSLLQEAAIPLFFEGYRLSSWPGKDSAARSAALGMLRVGREGWSMALSGKSGVGKTALAVGILRERVVGMGLSGIYLTAADYLDRLRPGIEVDEIMMGRVKRVKTLVLDDVGVERSPSAWYADQLHRLLNFRHNAGLSTIVVTPLSKEALRALLGEGALAGMRHVRVGGASLRREQYNGQLQQNT